MITLNLIKILSKEESSFAINFDDGDNRQTNFRLIIAKDFFDDKIFCDDVRFDTSFFDIA